ncbi:Flagellar transcriptional activator, partial [mine drainage metagenome]
APDSKAGVFVAHRFYSYGKFIKLLIYSPFRARHNGSHRDPWSPVHPNLRRSSMNPTQLHEEIKDTNLSYLMLAQNMINQDMAAALFRLESTQKWRI